jgi:hypothetical protein
MRKGPVFLSVTSSANLSALDATAKKLREVGRSSAATNKGLSGFGKSLAKVASVSAVIGIGVKAINEATEAFKTTALTEQLLKNTGLAASVSSKQIGDLAMQISNLTGIDDEQVQAASNVLLGFRDLVPAGKNAQSTLANLTQVATDLGVKMGKDPAAAAKMLGKALTDPAKGVALLYRAGIPLDKQLSDRIKLLAKSGQAEQARALLLQNVASGTKGLAAAVADPMTRLQTMMNNLLESVGLPLLEALMPVFAALQPVIEALSPTLAVLGRGLGVIIKQIADALIPYLPLFADLLAALVPIVVDVLKVVTPLLPLFLGLVPVITLVAKALGVLLKPALFVIQGALLAVTGIIAGFLKVLSLALGWVPGLGSALKTAANAAGDAATQLMKVSLASTDSQMSDGLATQAVNYKDAAAALAAGAKSANTAAGAMSKSVGGKKVKPKTATTPRSRAMGDQSFTVAGTGGGLALSVTVNGSVVQERDIARTIRDELLQFARRQGANPQFGV